MGTRIKTALIQKDANLEEQKGDEFQVALDFEIVGLGVKKSVPL